MLSPKVLNHNVGIRIEDFARIHQAVGIEYIFDFTKQFVIFITILTSHEGRSCQALGVFAAYRASQRPGERNNVIGHCSHFFDIRRIAQIQIGAYMQQAVSGVTKERHRDIITLADL